jgi:hypothetical protein
MNLYYISDKQILNFPFNAMLHIYQNYINFNTLHTRTHAHKVIRVKLCV